MKRCEERGSWDETSSQCLGKSKLKGAIEAIQKFNEDVAGRSQKTKIAIVPFSQSGRFCVGKKVNRKTLNEFKPAGSDAIKKILNELQQTASKDVHNKEIVKILSNWLFVYSHYSLKLKDFVSGSRLQWL